MALVIIIEMSATVGGFRKWDFSAVLRPRDITDPRWEPCQAVLLNAKIYR
jgi:hypothetical protein